MALHAFIVRRNLKSSVGGAVGGIKSLRFIIMLVFILIFWFILGMFAFSGAAEMLSLNEITKNAIMLAVSYRDEQLAGAGLLISGGQTLITMLFIISASIYYTVQFSKEELNQFLLYSLGVFFSGLLFVSASSLGTMFIAYELILIPTALMLEKFSKTGRSREATRFMIA